MPYPTISCVITYVGGNNGEGSTFVGVGIYWKGMRGVVVFLLFSWGMGAVMRGTVIFLLVSWGGMRGAVVFLKVFVVWLLLVDIWVFFWSWFWALFET